MNDQPTRPTRPPGTSGVDLARVALQAARAAAKNAPTQPQPRRKKTQALLRNGRDPLPVGTAVTHLIADRAWEVPTAGSNLVDQWPSIAPELAGKVHAERWDPHSGCIHLRPASPAFATQLRLYQRQLIDRINTKATGCRVTSLRILPPGITTTATAQLPEPPSPIRARRALKLQDDRTHTDTPEGFHTAKAIVRDALEKTRTDPHQALRDKHFADTRGSLRERPQDFTDALVLQERLAQARSRTADPQELALKTARARRNALTTSGNSDRPSPTRRSQRRSEV